MTINGEPRPLLGGGMKKVRKTLEVRGRKVQAHQDNGRLALVPDVQGQIALWGQEPRTEGSKNGS